MSPGSGGVVLDTTGVGVGKCGVNLAELSSGNFFQNPSGLLLTIQKELRN